MALPRKTPVRFIAGVMALLALTSLGQDAEKANQNKLSPTRGNVAYGSHERNVLDFWQARSDKPAPLAIFIHGGGFTGGSKEQIGAGNLKELLAAGISVAAINYRYLSHAPLPAAHDDARRALQFLRSKSADWNLEKTRVGAFGGSAGAQLCMYLGFHDEMANPKSADPVERESTRLTCVVSNGGQTTMDDEWWAKNIPGWGEPPLDTLKTFGVKTKEAYLAKVKDTSALALISKDDPPIFMAYAMAPGDPVPADAQAVRRWKVHHVIFGIELKQEMDKLGVEADLQYPGAKTKYDSPIAFLIAKLRNAGK